MSWLYVPALVDSNSVSAPSSQALASSATSSATPTPSPSCEPESRTACSTTHLSGMTPAPSTASPGMDAWISSVRAIRASRNQQPADASELMTGVGSGKRCIESFAMWEQDIWWSKTSQLTFREPGREYSGTWPRAGGMSNGNAYQRQPLAPRTYATAYSLSLHAEYLQSLLPAPTDEHQLTLFSGEEPQPSLLPTPTACAYGSNRSPSPRAKTRPSLAMLAKSGLLITPCKSDADRSGSDGTSRQGGPTLTDCTVGPCGGRNGRRLSPHFVEWMMGLPAGWSDAESAVALPCSEMQLSPKPQPERYKSSGID